MAGPWLYALNLSGLHKWELPNKLDGRPVTFDSYRHLVEIEHLGDDPNWPIAQHARHVEDGDEVYLYSGYKDVGIIGWARVKMVEFNQGMPCLVLDFNFPKCRALLENPIPAAQVRAWKLKLQKNVIDLAPVVSRLRALLPPQFGESVQISVAERELSDGEIDQAIRDGRLLLTENVPTGIQRAMVRVRRGQDRLRQLTLENYGSRCAVCDISDRDLLVTSHIVGWAASPKHRGDLSNAMCLCRIHDALFEADYWSLGDQLQLLRKEKEFVKSDTIRRLLKEMTAFQKPKEFIPAKSFLSRHRKEHGWNR